MLGCDMSDLAGRRCYIRCPIQSRFRPLTKQATTNSLSIGLFCLASSEFLFCTQSNGHTVERWAMAARSFLAAIRYTDRTKCL